MKIENKTQASVEKTTVPSGVAAKKVAKAIEAAEPKITSAVDAVETATAETVEKVKKTKQRVKKDVSTATKTVKGKFAVSVFLEYGDLQYSVKDVVNTVLDVCPSADNVYIKPEDNCAYYTSKDGSGSVTL